MFTIAKFIAGLFGWDISKVQRIVVIVFIIGGLLLIVSLGFWLKSCFTKKPKIDEAQIQKINSKNKAEREAELKVVIEQNADTIKIVDNRTAEAELSIEQRDKLIDAKVKEADKKITEAKAATGKDVTSAELECILTGDCQ